MAYLTQKHKTYYAVFSINRKRKWIKIGRVDKKSAKKVLKQLEIEHLKGKLDISEIKQILLYDFLEQYLRYSKTNKAPNTYRIERGISGTLRSYFGNVLLNRLDNRAIEEYKVSRISSGLLPASINRELASIRFMLRKAFEWGYLKKIPSISLLKLPKRPSSSYH